MTSIKHSAWQPARHSVFNILHCLLAALVLAATHDSMAAERELQTIAVNGGEIEYEISGTGEPLLMIHGTGIASTFALVMDDPALADFRRIRMHRRGFGGSSRTPVPFTIKDHAADARGLLEALGIEKAHVFGHSFGGSVALQLAADAPEIVQSLVVSDAALFTTTPASFAALIETYESGNKEDAMNRFSTMSYGADWRTLALRMDPDGPQQVMNDVDTVFQTETPAMVNWGFGEADAQRISAPILFVTGRNGASGALNSLRTWIEPLIDVAVIPDTTHALLMQDPAGVANAVAPFLRRYPLNEE